MNTDYILEKSTFMSKAELSKHGPAHVGPEYRDIQDLAASQHSDPEP